MPARKRAIQPARIRALEVLDGCGSKGCVEGILTAAHGVSIADLVELVRAGLATTTSERVRAGRIEMEVAMLRITDAGRRALEKARQ
jgi:hypothetical protein